MPAYDAWRAWRPQWRPGYGPLQISAGVTLVREEGAVLAGEHAGLEVQTEDVRIESPHR